MLNRVLALFAAATLSVAAHAVVAPPVEDLEYSVQKVPQAVTTGKKIEIMEFFWYRCPHCYKLEPALNAWLAKLPKDAQIKRMPAVFNDSWLPGAKIFYALQDIGAEKLHDKVFDAYHRDNLDLNNEAVLMDWIAKQGVDRAKFQAAYQSFSTQSKATQGSMLARVYDLKGVPSFVVDGRYVTSETMTGSEPRLFEVLDQLITKARKARAPGKPAKKK
jgi:thiol:disulfide interchange protein DsbA